MKVRIQSKNESHEVVDLNRRKAIRKLCLNCVNWHPSEIRECEDTKCPLHPYRSGIGKQDPKAREKAIRNYCLWCSGGKYCKVAKCPIKDCPLFAFRKKRLDRSVEVDLEIKKRPIEFDSLAN